MSEPEPEEHAVFITPAPRFTEMTMVSLYAPSDPAQVTDFLLRMRAGLLAEVDYIERVLGIKPTTAEMRKANKT